ncbi:hypothetical protein [Opitutus terrae]|uniref:Uncharacterized protein n=1 Tax=Opitutus terrae (strain DSM 11246 / JCM 15787 / PB90-1) TaxID=452637 RepID=B1ZZG8_OPITP|nr:hypothetical protein [Opitutus terrae]ACB76371.1 hypothetical protein Oter_3091 [Opitutus terrae PB90-1]
MELTLHPLAKTCRVSGRAFAEGDRVISRLVREASGEIARHDVLASEDAGYAPPAFIFCTWAVPFKARRAEENPDRAMKLTAENLFVTLADPLAEPDEANTPLLQFLALMLERKKILRPRGLTTDRMRQVYEHAKTHQRYEIPAGTLDVAFFVKIQGQLDLLVGGPKRAQEPQPPAAPANESGANVSTGRNETATSAGAETSTTAGVPVPPAERSE